jgi:hypothetical protein
MQNLQLKMPYKFKKSYGGTPEPQHAWMHPGCTDPLLKYYAMRPKPPFRWSVDTRANTAAIRPHLRPAGEHTLTPTGRSHHHHLQWQ